MVIFRVNPEAEASKDFPVFQPGTYRMRVKEVRDRESNPAEGKEPKPDFQVTLEYVDPNQLMLENGQIFVGKIEGAGSLFDYIQKNPEMQWKMRQFNEALGLTWGDFDPEQDWLGKELDVKVGIETYEGEKRNKVKRYVAPKR